MTDERVNAVMTVHAPADVVFGVLADPSTHRAIDGTGGVRDALDAERLTEVGQIFRVAMYHDNHPEKDYEMANRVEVIDPPRAIAWQPGQGPEQRGYLMGGTELTFGGWVCHAAREAPGPARALVTLTSAWSGVPPQMRDIESPPFDVAHLRWH